MQLQMTCLIKMRMIKTTPESYAAAYSDGACPGLNVAVIVLQSKNILKIKIRDSLSKLEIVML